LFLFDLFRSYLPLHNPIGFGAGDFVEFALAAILVSLVLFWGRIVAAAHFLAVRPRVCMAALAVLPIGLRLALLPHYPVPTPGGSDDFSYLLLGDTLRHGRLANPVHPMHEFFESIFVLQEPSYSSIFPLGQGVVLTVGWAGVLLSGGVFCALCFWMLRAWTTPVWALLGGLLAVAEFGPLCGWMNDYWGGYVSGCAGCLVFGALGSWRVDGRTRDSLLLGIGFALQWLTRPFESVLLLVPVLVGIWRIRRFPRAAMAPIALALALSAMQNHAVTKSWTTLPYVLSRYEYGVPASFTVQPNPVPHRALTAEQQLDYRAQAAVHGQGTDTPAAYFRRLASRATFIRFFLLVPLFAAPLWLVRERKFFWVFSTLAILALGTNFYPYFHPHYVAAAACLFLLISVASLSRMSRDLGRNVILLCAAHAIFWYSIHLAGSPNQRIAMMRLENWDYINFGDPEGRIAINQKLNKLPGRQLVFVRYSQSHGFHEWIQNPADIDDSRVVWAADLGEDANRRLLSYYPTRNVFLVEPDAVPPRLTPYR
jgi:hypothetical protein